MTGNTIRLFVQIVTLLTIATSAFAQNPDPTPTPFKPSVKSLKVLSKQLKNAFKDVGSDILDLGQSFAQTLASKSSWTGNAITGNSSGVTLTAITVTFTPDPEDNTTGTWTSTPISLADLGGGNPSGEFAIFGSAMYLYNISGSASSSATLLITLPKPGSPILSFQLGNVSPPIFMTLE